MKNLRRTGYQREEAVGIGSEATRLSPPYVLNPGVWNHVFYLI